MLITGLFKHSKITKAHKIDDVYMQCVPFHFHSNMTLLIIDLQYMVDINPHCKSKSNFFNP